MNIRRWILIIFPFIFLLYLSITPAVLAEKKEQPILKIEFKDGKFVKTETTREEEERKRKEGKKEKEFTEEDKKLIITAFSIALIADFIIIGWVAYKNMGDTPNRGNNITNSKWFWAILGMGAFVKKDEKIIIRWPVVFAYIFLGVIAKFYIFEKL